MAINSFAIEYHLLFHLIFLIFMLIFPKIAFSIHLFNLIMLVFSLKNFIH